MNTATGYTHINLTIPKELVEHLKRHTANMSKYISEAIRERLAREAKDKALREILAAKPTFTRVKDGKSYVHELRAEDKKRDSRLGLL